MLEMLVMFRVIIIYEGLVKIQEQKDRIFEGYGCGIYSELAVNLSWHFLIQPSRDSHDIWDAFAPTACLHAKFYTGNHDMNTLCLAKC